MSVHRIRLIGPWEFVLEKQNTDQSIADADGKSDTGPSAGNVKMPCDWQTLFGTDGGNATFSRRFHRPTNLESHEQVVIVLTGVGGKITITLNGTRVGEYQSHPGVIEVDVTARLSPFNVLEIGICFEPKNDPKLRGGLFDPVVLEIRTTS